MDTSKEIRILTSVLEFRQSFSDPWLDLWSSPGGMAGRLLGPLRKYGVELRDISFYPNATNLSEQTMAVAFRPINAVAKFGLDSLSVSVNNPSLDSMESLNVAVAGILNDFRLVVGKVPLRQEAELSVHVFCDGLDIHAGTARLVDTALLGEAVFYAVGVYREDVTLVIDKSAAHEKAVFLKIQRRFAGNLEFSEVLPMLLSDELAALRLLGFDSVA